MADVYGLAGLRSFGAAAVRECAGTEAPRHAAGLGSTAVTPCVRVRHPSSSSRLSAGFPPERSAASTRVPRKVRLLSVTSAMEAKRGGAQSSGSGSESSGDSPAGSPSRRAAPVGNAFANDGSFMEMFKKKMEEEERRRKEEEQRKSEKGKEEGGSGQEKKTCSVTSFVGKRRGGAKLVLKTGMVAKKQKLEPEAEAGKGDAWTKYMAEVKKYKAHQCGDDDKTRPLVK